MTWKLKVKYIICGRIVFAESKRVWVVSRVKSMKTASKELWAASYESARSVSEIRELVLRETLYPNRIKCPFFFCFQSEASKICHFHHDFHWIHIWILQTYIKNKWTEILIYGFNIRDCGDSIQHSRKLIRLITSVSTRRDYLQRTRSVCCVWLLILLLIIDTIVDVIVGRSRGMSMFRSMCTLFVAVLVIAKNHRQVKELHAFPSDRLLAEIDYWLESSCLARISRSDITGAWRVV